MFQPIDMSKSPYTLAEEEQARAMAIGGHAGDPEWNTNAMAGNAQQQPLSAYGQAVMNDARAMAGGGAGYGSGWGGSTESNRVYPVQTSPGVPAGYKDQANVNQLQGMVDLIAGKNTSNAANPWGASEISGDRPGGRRTPSLYTPAQAASWLSPSEQSAIGQWGGAGGGTPAPSQAGLGTTGALSPAQIATGIGAMQNPNLPNNGLLGGIAALLGGPGTAAGGPLGNMLGQMGGGDALARLAAAGPGAFTGNPVPPQLGAFGGVGPLSAAGPGAFTGNPVPPQLGAFGGAGPLGAAGPGGAPATGPLLGALTAMQGGGQTPLQAALFGPGVAGTGGTSPQMAANLAQQMPGAGMGPEIQQLLQSLQQQSGGAGTGGSSPQMAQNLLQQLLASIGR